MYSTYIYCSSSVIYFQLSTQNSAEATLGSDPNESSDAIGAATYCKSKPTSSKSSKRQHTDTADILEKACSVLNKDDEFDIFAAFVASEICMLKKEKTDEY